MQFFVFLLSREKQNSQIVDFFSCKCKQTVVVDQIHVYTMTTHLNERLAIFAPLDENSKARKQQFARQHLLEVAAWRLEPYASARRIRLVSDEQRALFNKAAVAFANAARRALDRKCAHRFEAQDEKTAAERCNEQEIFCRRHAVACACCCNNFIAVKKLVSRTQANQCALQMHNQRLYFRLRLSGADIHAIEETSTHKNCAFLFQTAS